MRRWYSLFTPPSARSITWLAILTVSAISFLALLGWMLDITLLKSVKSQWADMRLMTATCLALSAIQLALLQSYPSRVRRSLILQVPAALVALVGLVTVALYCMAKITGQEPSLGSRLLVHYWEPATRPALLTSILFLIIGFDLLLLAAGSRRAANVAHAVILPAAIASYLVPVTYVLDAQAMHGWLNIPVAANTGIALCAVCVAIFSLRPDTWLISVLTGDHVGGIMARRLLPAMLIIPLLIGRLRLYGERSGAFASEVGIVLVAVTYTVCLFWLVWLSARSVNRTDHKRREIGRALQQSEEILRLFVRHAPAAVAMFDREMRYLAHSDRWIEDYGIRQREILGQCHYAVFPEIEARWKAVHQRCLLGASEKCGEDQFVRQDGRTDWLQWEIHPWRTGDQQIGGIIIFSEHITARKLAEQRLEQQRALLEAIFESSDGPVFSVDRNYRYTSFNTQHADVMEALFGARIESGHNLLDYHTNAENRAAAQRNLDRALLGERVTTEAIAGQEGRSRRYFEISHNPVRDSRGDVTGVAVFARDLTQRKQAEDALRQAKEEWERTFDSVPDLIAILDNRHRISRANKAMAERLGRSPQECIHLRCYEHVHGTSAPPASCPHLRSLADGREHVEEIQEPRLGGDFLVSTTPLHDEQGRITGAVHVARDITERKKAEEALRRTSEELDLRVHERTNELALTVSALHEEVSERILTEQTLRERSEQLRFLASELTLAEQRERQRLAQVLHDGLQQILVGAKFRLAMVERSRDVRMATQEVAELIDEAIETSRSLTAELSPPILRHGGLVPALEWLSRWMHDKQGLSVDLQVREHFSPAPEEVTVLLFQATRELLFNIVKHAGVKTARVEIAHCDGWIQVAVGDKGVGFDPSRLRTQEGGSVGIGLFTFRERLMLLGGRMEIDSAPGRGTQVRLAVPRPAPAEQAGRHLSEREARVSVVDAHPREVEAADAGIRIRVVLVDDHMVVRQGLAGLFQSAPDLEIVGEASDGEAAVDLVRKVRPDVVLMDINMPGMDGIQATRAIHGENPEVRIIGLSMFEEGEQAAAMRQAGACDYLTKSGPSDAVIHAIRACVRPV